MPSGKGARLALKKQYPRVHAVLIGGINDILTNVCLTNAYPDGPEMSNEFGRGALLRAAKDLNDRDILTRLKTNEKYWRPLSNIVSVLRIDAFHLVLTLL